MRLYLVRHGEAVSKLLDPDRPLSARGREEVESVAALLDHAGVRVSRVLHSGKRRAEQTAEILAEAVGGKLERTDGIAPMDSAGAFSEIVAGWTEEAMVVGHLPFMALLTSRLLCRDEEIFSARFEAGTVVGLERGNEGRWSLVGMVPPRWAR
ncbi:MAG: phosphohistidine phosphatase SixA [Planctomycetota bacterium]|jgi:phosphohistidine phosphatase